MCRPVINRWPLGWCACSHTHAYAHVCTLTVNIIFLSTLGATQMYALNRYTRVHVTRIILKSQYKSYI